MERISVEYSASRQRAASTLADKSGIEADNLYALAFVMGARTMSSTLTPFTFFSSGAVAREMKQPRQNPNRDNRSTE